MPLTTKDLEQWEREKDTDKFFQILKYLFEDEFIEVQIAAIEALGRIRDNQSLNYLLEMLHSNNPILNNCARMEINNWVWDDINAICEFVEDDNQEDEFRYEGIKILSENLCERVFETYFNLLKRGYWIKAIQRIVSKMDDMSPILSKLEDVDTEMRYVTLLALGGVQKNPTVIIGFIQALSDEDVQVRYLAERQLLDEIVATKKEEEYWSQHHDLYNSSIAPLQENLKHDDFLIRQYAVQVLGEIPDQESISILTPLLKDLCEPVRIATLDAIEKCNKLSTKD